MTSVKAQFDRPRSASIGHPEVHIEFVGNARRSSALEHPPVPWRTQLETRSAVSQTWCVTMLTTPKSRDLPWTAFADGRTLVLENPIAVDGVRARGACAMTIDPSHVARVLKSIRAAPLSERAEVLRRECGDDADLRDAVEAVLSGESRSQGGASSGTDETVLGESEPHVEAIHQSMRHVVPTGSQPNEPDPMGTTRLQATDPVASAIIADRYTLLEKIGEGGMGEVWAARQSSPVKRKVALKLIKRGMNSRDVLVRFEQERQALALMEHPNIASVFDAGTTPTGQPFFVMELVKGLPLTKFCDAQQLTPQKRLQLFVPICQAVQHAHQKGVVHRDLKPANILVSEIDGKPTPKIIDFGVAKATVGKLTDETMSTGFGAVVGTLEYMAPEQAGTTGEDVDTRADIYSLGVLLYELLTGLRPFDGAELRKAALSEMIRIIREEDPARPSTRLSGSDSLPSLAAVRQTEPAKLMAELHGELDWVIMKCLEKTRDRRYATANGLARDIQRYLSDEPVEARPPSAGYRLQKFFSRHRTPVLAAGLVLLSMIGGIVGTTWGLMKAREQTRIAVGEKKAAETARASESEQKALAERANQQAFEALRSFTSDLMGNVLGSKSGLTETEIAVLQNAARQWEVFAQSRGSSVDAREIRAEGARNLAVIQNRLGLYRDVVANNRKTLTIRKGLAAEFPDKLELRRKLARAHQDLGGGLRTIGQRAEAGEQFRNSADVLTELLLAVPGDPDYRSALSDSYVSMGNVARDFGRQAESRDHYLEALKLQESLVAEFPESRLYKDSLASAHWGLAFLNKRMERKDESARHYRKTIAIYDQIVAAAMADDTKPTKESQLEALEYREFIANLHREFGVMLSDLGDDESGSKELAKSVAMHKGFSREFPSVDRYQVDFAKANRDYAQVLRYLKQYSKSREHYDIAVETLVRIAAKDPSVLPHQAELGSTYRMLGDLVSDGDSPEDSLQWYNKAVEVLNATYVQDPDHRLVISALFTACRHRAETLDHFERHVEALSDWDRAVELCSRTRYDPNIIRTQRADSRLRGGDVAKAISELKAIDHDGVTNPFHWINLARLYAIAGEQLPKQQQELKDQAMNFLTKAVSLGFSDAARLRSEEDLATLRVRADFRKLLDDLKIHEE